MPIMFPVVRKKFCEALLDHKIEPFRHETIKTGFTNIDIEILISKNIFCNTNSKNSCGSRISLGNMFVVLN